ncbi:hypothetical protein Lal_00022270 [Lupinus albus]|nr:hypothetical protein Lal_00022270 [Lupinus albus]
MEGKDNFCGGGNALAVVSGEAPDSFHVAPRIENNLDFSMATVPVPALATEGKKKRGRPRKYGPDGKVAAFPLSPMPISSSILLTGEFSAWKGGRGRTVDSIKKSTYKYEVESPGPDLIYASVLESLCRVGALYQYRRFDRYTGVPDPIQFTEQLCGLLGGVTEFPIKKFFKIKLKGKNIREISLWTFINTLFYSLILYLFINSSMYIIGERIAYSVGANFTAHVLTVNAGEDVTMKIMSFAQQGSCAICILSANGSISNVTLRQPTSSGGTLTYEGRFEILSLSGSFMPTENGIARSRSGGMSVSLAGPDGRVMGGGLAGLLIAAGPVQVVVGSFLPGHRLEHKNTKQRVEHISTITTTHINPISIDGGIKFSFGGFKPIMTPAAFQEENIISYNNVQDSRNSSADDKEAFPEESNPSQ